MPAQTFSVEDGALSAPCRFCGYEGPDYYRAGTHARGCLWHTVGGLDERKAELVRALSAASAAVDAAVVKAVVDARNRDASLALKDRVLRLREENAELRRLLWLRHLKEVDVDAPDGGGMTCPGCAGDFGHMTPAELERCMWRCQWREGATNG
jgi:hypothetical protein